MNDMVGKKGEEKIVFIIHGAYGSPEENWFPSLKKELETKGVKVIAPRFPTPENQTLENWLDTFYVHKCYITENTIFVGHSLGVPFILSILENLDIKVKAGFFVSGFCSFLGNKFDNINKSFVDKEFNWKKINERCNQFCLYYSKDDPYVSFENFQELANKLENKESFIYADAGHFNKDSGYTEFKEILEKILSFY